MFFFKKLIAVVATPLILALLVGAAGGVFRARGRRRTALWLFVSAATLVYLSALSPVGDVLLGPLERKYPAPRVEKIRGDVKFVVVLGSSYSPGAGIPITAALDEDGLARIVEGVRLTRQLGVAHLIVSGGARPGFTPTAAGYAKLARALGIDAATLKVVDTPRDTNEEARAISRLVGSSEFLLVTSAYHMPRAMWLMRNAGAHPIPMATGQSVRGAAGLAWSHWLPTSLGLRKTERALHEYLGLAALAVGIS